MLHNINDLGKIYTFTIFLLQLKISNQFCPSLYLVDEKFV